MDASAPDGVYTVDYKGCWPDKTCHDGSFRFAIDRSQANSCDDKRNQKTVIIKLSDTKFQPANLRISRGTTVTWVNDDAGAYPYHRSAHAADMTGTIIVE